MSNPYLDQVREELRAAKRDVERARDAYNEKLKIFQKQKARYESISRCVAGQSSRSVPGRETGIASRSSDSKNASALHSAGLIRLG